MPDDLKILEDMLSGLVTKGKELADKEALFIKSQGLDESIQRNQKEKQELELGLIDLKDDLKALKADKKEAVGSVSEKICAKLNEFLPVGKAFFDISEGLLIGWEYEGTRQPYNSLSGGQKAIFDSALENLLGSNIAIIEAGEIDSEHLTSLLEDLAETGKQVFVNSWHKVEIIPKEFEVVEVVDI